MSADTVGAAQLRAFIERIERLEEEKKTIADDIKDIYAEAKGNGFDTKAIRTIVKLRKVDQAEREEAEAILDTYKAALGMLPLFEAEPSYAEAKGHEITIPSFAAFTSDGGEYHYDAETGEVTDNSFLGPHSQEVDDGQPHPSSNASGAKCDGAQTIVGRADGRSGLSITQLEQQDASVSQDRNEPISDSEATVSHSNTTLATSPEASRKAGESVLLPLSPAANPDDDVPDFLKRGAA